MCECVIHLVLSLAPWERSRLAMEVVGNMTARSRGVSSSSPTLQERTEYTVFLLKIRHLLFFSTLSLKCVLNLQISASALVLRHSKPTAQREKSFTSRKRAVDAFLFKTRARHHTSNYSALMELLPQLLPNIGQANLKLFTLRRIFRRNTVTSLKQT